MPILSIAAISVVVFAAAAAFLFLSGRPRVGSRVGPYRLERWIGEGGMGVVYRARHERLQRPAAVKLLPHERSSEVNVARFEREVRITAQLTHPNTIAIFDYGRTARGLFYYGMEFLNGLNLQQLVERFGPLEDSRIAFIVRQVCSSLSEAHDLGLVHRDIKPSNIFLCERGGQYDYVKVLDFGVAKDISQIAGPLTRPGALVGTPAYASPEMVRGAKVDVRSDVYALGLVMYYLRTGEELFAGGSTVETLQRHIDFDPSLSLGSLGPLEGVIRACLSTSPRDRPQSAGELREAIDALGLSGWGTTSARAWWTSSPREGFVKTS